MTTEEKLIRTTYFLGLIPLTVGLLIFLTWWTGKVWFLVTMHRLEEYGLLWVLISLPIGLMGLLTAGAYIFKTYKTNLKKGIIGLLCVLINIPVLLWVIKTQNDIEQRTYTRIYNKTDENFKEVVIENSVSSRQFGSLDKDDYKTRYFYPFYLNGDFDSSPLVDPARLIITTEKEKKVIGLKTIYKNDGIKIIVDKDFKVTVKRPYED